MSKVLGKLNCRPRSLGIAAPVVVLETGVKCNRPPARPIEVGERFRSIAWAECSTGIARSHIVGQLSGRVKHARGVVFGYEWPNGKKKGLAAEHTK